MRSSVVRWSALRATCVLRDAGNDTPSPPPNGSNSKELADPDAELQGRFQGRGAPDRGVLAFLDKSRKQAAVHADTTKRLGVKGAIQKGRHEQNDAMKQAAAAREVANKQLTSMKPGERIRAIATGRYDPGSHFLMLDLDFEKDGLIFGTTREEFYENVDKMKRVIVEYHKWERNDNFYLWGTRLVQFFAACFIYDSWEQERFKVLLASSLVSYREQHEMDLEGIEQRRIDALERAVLELEVRPPNFDDLLAERQRLEASTTEADVAAYKRHPMDTMDRERAVFEEDTTRKRALVSNALSPTAIPAVKNLRRVLMPQTSDWTVAVREEMMEYKAAKLKTMSIPDQEGASEPLGRTQQLVQPVFDAVPRREPKAALS